jgi:hypothetical protein
MMRKAITISSFSVAFGEPFDRPKELPPFTRMGDLLGYPQAPLASHLNFDRSFGCCPVHPATDGQTEGANGVVALWMFFNS